MRIPKEFAALALIAALSIAYFFPVIFLGKTFYLRDLTYIFHPWKTLCSQAVQSGDLPLWNQYAFCGMPLLANWQTAVFYPFSVFFYIFDFTAGLKLYHIFAVCAAGYFAYLFGKKELKSNTAGLVMLVLFGFNGFVTTKLEFLSYAGVISWTFALLTFRKKPLLLGISLCFSFLAGHQVFVFQSFILALFMAYDCSGILTDAAALKKYSTNAILASLLAFGLAACQIFPTIELMALSYRKITGIDYSIAMLHSLKISDLLGFISPLIRRTGDSMVAGEFLQWDTTVYIGVMGILLAFYGLLSRSFGKMRAVSVMLGISGVLLAMGDTTPVYPWLFRHSFIFHTMRYPAQYAYFSVVAIVILAGLGARSFRYGWLLVVLLALELTFLAVKFRQPLTDDGYFSQKPRTVAILQKAKGDNRFILSPGTEKDRFIAAGSIEAGWREARNRLYNLTCLPYRLPNAYGFGEPLTGQLIESRIGSVYAIPDARTASVAFKALGASYLVCKDRLSKTTEYALLTDMPPYIYKLSSNPGIFEFIPDDSGVSVFKRSGVFNNRSFVFDSESPKRFVWKESDYPGWDLFVNGRHSRVKTYDGIFPEFNIGPGLTKAYYIYRPFSFMLGLLLTLISAAAVIFLGFRSLIRNFNE